jgi:hypothetical protein
MRAVVTKDFKGKDNHSPRCIQYVEGQEIDDPIATSAVKAGDAEPLPEQGERRKVPPANKAAAPPENKTAVDDGQAGNDDAAAKQAATRAGGAPGDVPAAERSPSSAARTTRASRG